MFNVDVSNEDFEYLQFLVHETAERVMNDTNKMVERADEMHSLYKFGEDIVSADKSMIEGWKSTINVLHRISKALDVAEDANNRS